MKIMRTVTERIMEHQVCDGLNCDRCGKTSKHSMQTVTERIKEHQVCDGLKCDRCGKTSKHSFGWSKSPFEIDEITIMRKTGYSFPEGGSGEISSVDLCPECWEHLIAILAASGAILNCEDWES